MTWAHGLLLGGGLLVLLIGYGLIRQSRRHSYRIRDLTDLSSEIDPDWDRYRRTMRRPEILREAGGDGDETPPQERSS